MLARWYRIGSSSCSLQNSPLVPNSRLPLLRRHVVTTFPRSPCDVVPTFHGFVRTALFLHALTTVGVLSSIYLHNLRNSYFVPSGNDALRFDDLGLLD